MPKARTDYNPQSHIHGQTVETGLRKIFIPENLVQDYIPEKKRGSEQQSVPSDGKRSYTEYLGIDIPGNDK
jgi:hypothetical protein